jgi:hypothetical protein
VVEIEAPDADQRVELPRRHHVRLVRSGRWPDVDGARFVDGDDAIVAFIERRGVVERTITRLHLPDRGDRTCAVPATVRALVLLNGDDAVARIPLGLGAVPDVVDY